MDWLNHEQLNLCLVVFYSISIFKTLGLQGPKKILGYIC